MTLLSLLVQPVGGRLLLISPAFRQIGHTLAPHRARSPRHASLERSRRSPVGPVTPINVSTARSAGVSTSSADIAPSIPHGAWARPEPNVPVSAALRGEDVWLCSPRWSEHLTVRMTGSSSGSVLPPVAEGALDPSRPGVEAVHTHVSQIIFDGDLVHKRKKSVRFAFVDLSTPERREQMCHREVELNRRFSPDVYLGVEEIVDDAGSVVDHAVVMRRMPAERRLATLVQQHRDVSGVSACGRSGHGRVPCGSGYERRDLLGGHA